MNKWDGRFLKIAEQVASWSRDPSSKISAVAVDENRRILGTGYNGFPKTDDDYILDYLVRDVKYSKIIHAEKNLILNCLNNGVTMKGATVYIWGLPVCKTCANELIQAGVSRIVAVWDKQDPKTKNWEKEWVEYSSRAFRKAKIDIETFDRKTDTYGERVVALRFDEGKAVAQMRYGSEITKPDDEHGIVSWVQTLNGE